MVPSGLRQPESVQSFASWPGSPLPEGALKQTSAKKNCAKPARERGSLGQDGYVGKRGRCYGSSPPPSVWTVPPTQNGWGGDLKQTGSFDRAGLRLRQPQYKNPRPMLRPRLRQPLFFEKPRLASRPREGEAQSSPCWPKKHIPASTPNIKGFGANLWEYLWEYPASA